MYLYRKVSLFACCGLTSFAVMANGSDLSAELRQQLGQFDGFNAEFKQNVTSAQQQLVYEGRGQLSIAKPGKLRWEQREPDQDQIISDGQTIWYYSPFVEQVSIYNTDDAIANTPFILLTDQRESLWQGYQVDLKDGWYWVASKEDANQPKFAISFSESGDIASFVIVDNQGQRSEFSLSAFNRQSAFSADLFSFTVPEGTSVDDQR